MASSSSLCCASSRCAIRAYSTRTWHVAGESDNGLGVGVWGVQELLSTTVERIAVYNDGLRKQDGPNNLVMNVLHTGRNEHDARRVQRPCRPFCFPQPFENLCLHSPVTGDTQSKLGSLKWLSNERSRIAIVNGACNIMGSCRTDGRRYISEKCKYSQKKAIIEFQNRFVPARLLPKAVSLNSCSMSK
jgi:hypothetical protein